MRVVIRSSKLRSQSADWNDDATVKAILPEVKHESLQIAGLRPPNPFAVCKNNVNPLSILVHLHQLCAQRAKEWGLSCQVESSTN